MSLGLLLMAAIVSTADCYKYSILLYASTTTKLKSVTVSPYNYYEIEIQPSSLSNSYYLEIAWATWKFDVTGNMPFCKEAYMEVFLTRAYKSIGKFCSNNAGAPFTMYSRDGYATIIVSANVYGARGAVTFYYKLKSNSQSSLGISVTSSFCYNAYNYGRSGVIYSTRWPYNYKRSISPCGYLIQKLNSYQAIYVVFMDINLFSSHGNSSDCVQLFGSNQSSFYIYKAISSPLCGAANTKTYSYITYNKNLIIHFDRRNMLSSGSYRGFVAGYIMFGAPTALTTGSPTTKPTSNPVDETNSSSFHVVAVILGVVLPVVIIVGIAVVFCIKKRQRSTAWDADSNAVSMAQHTTTEQTLQNAAPPAYTSLAFSQPQQFYPTTSMQTAMCPTGTHILYPTMQSYSNGQFTAAGNAQTHSSIPSGALQLARASVIQTQQPAETLDPALSSSSNSVERAPIPPTTVEMPRNVPPPAYCDVA